MKFPTGSLSERVATAYRVIAGSEECRDKLIVGFEVTQRLAKIRRNLHVLEEALPENTDSRSSFKATITPAINPHK